MHKSLEVAIARFEGADITSVVVSYTSYTDTLLSFSYPHILHCLSLLHSIPGIDHCEKWNFDKGQDREKKNVPEDGFLDGHHRILLFFRNWKV